MKRFRSLAMTLLTAALLSVAAPADASNDHESTLSDHRCDANLTHRWTSDKVMAHTWANGSSATFGTCDKLFVSVVYTFKTGSSTKQDYAYGEDLLHPDYFATVVFDRPAQFNLVYTMHKTWSHYMGDCGTMGCHTLYTSKSKSLS